MNVGCYVRVSTQEQAKEGYSIGEQTERLKAYCVAMNWTVVRVYTDPGFSGSNVNRPELQAMIRDVRSGFLQKIVVYKLDRLSRSQKDTLFLIEDVFLANKVDFVSMSENFDTSTPFGKAMIGILSVFAQLEREQIRERMSLGKEGRAKEGKWHGGANDPIGYDYIDGLLRVNEFEKMQLVELFDLFCNGKPLEEIVRLFDSKGYTHKHGKWNSTTMRRCLANALYIGRINHFETSFPGIHEPIIEQDIFNAAQYLLTVRKRDYESKRIRKTGTGSYLGGLLRCAHCNALYAHSVTKRKTKDGVLSYRYYGCYSRNRRNAKMVRDPNCNNKNWKADELEQIIFDQIRGLLLEPPSPEELSAVSKGNGIEEKINAITQEIKSKESQVSRLIDLFSTGRFSLDQVVEKTEPIQKQIAALQDQLDALKEDQQIGITRDEAFEFIRNFGEILDSGDFYEIRFLLERLIDHIEIDGDDITIHWNFD